MVNLRNRRNLRILLAVCCGLLFASIYDSRTSPTRYRRGYGQYTSHDLLVTPSPVGRGLGRGPDDSTDPSPYSPSQWAGDTHLNFAAARRVILFTIHDFRFTPSPVGRGLGRGPDESTDPSPYSPSQWAGDTHLNFAARSASSHPIYDLRFTIHGF
jgi:hypothetical protein